MKNNGFSIHFSCFANGFEEIWEIVGAGPLDMREHNLEHRSKVAVIRPAGLRGTTRSAHAVEWSASGSKAKNVLRDPSAPLGAKKDTRNAHSPQVPLGCAHRRAREKIQFEQTKLLCGAYFVAVLSRMAQAAGTCRVRGRHSAAGA